MFVRLVVKWGLYWADRVQFDYFCLYVSVFIRMKLQCEFFVRSLLPISVLDVLRRGDVPLEVSHLFSERLDPSTK